MLQFEASKVAASCICLSKLAVKRGGVLVADPWPGILAYESCYTLKQLIPCIQVLNMICLADSGQPQAGIYMGSELVAVHDKYTHQRVSFSGDTTRLLAR